VDTSNIDDYKILERVSTGMDGFSSFNQSIAGVQNLFGAFLDLCRHLIENRTMPSQRYSGDNGESGYYHNAYQPTKSGGRDDISFATGSVDIADNLAGCEDTNFPQHQPRYQGQDAEMFAYISTTGDQAMLEELYRTVPSLVCIEGMWLPNSN
jgi:hypothetical protein